MSVERVLLAEPRGFCAGVEMAIKALSWMVEAFDPPVYCYHEIVHNQLVVDRFRDQGVIFVDHIDDVPAGAPLMLSALGGVVGDSAVWRAMSDYAKAWRFKHPSPWDFAFFLNNALHQDLSWFWNYWLFTTESVEGSIQDVKTSGRRTAVTVRQDGQMPSPVILRVDFEPVGVPIRPMPNSRMTTANSAIVTYPVDVWFSGNRTFVANLDFGGRPISRITLDPNGRFPDRNAADNVWPRAQSAPKTSGGK